MNFLRVILYSGQNLAETPSGKRGVILSNAIGLILFAICSMLFVVYTYWYGWSFVSAAIPIIGLLALATIPASKLGYINVSRIWTSLLVPVVVTILSLASKITYYDTPEEL